MVQEMAVNGKGADIPIAGVTQGEMQSASLTDRIDELAAILPGRRDLQKGERSTDLAKIIRYGAQVFDHISTSLKSSGDYSQDFQNGINAGFELSFTRDELVHFELIAHDPGCRRYNRFSDIKLTKETLTYIKSLADSTLIKRVNRVRALHAIVDRLRTEQGESKSTESYDLGIRVGSKLRIVYDDFFIPVLKSFEQYILRVQKLTKPVYTDIPLSDETRIPEFNVTADPDRSSYAVFFASKREDAMQYLQTVSSLFPELRSYPVVTEKRVEAVSDQYQIAEIDEKIHLVRDAVRRALQESISKTGSDVSKAPEEKYMGLANAEHAAAYLIANLSNTDGRTQELAYEQIHNYLKCQEHFGAGHIQTRTRRKIESENQTKPVIYTTILRGIADHDDESKTEVIDPNFIRYRKGREFPGFNHSVLINTPTESFELPYNIEGGAVKPGDLIAGSKPF